MDNQTKKVAYTTPKLTEYGSVRNLTGGSSGSVGDVGINMTRMNAGGTM